MSPNDVAAVLWRRILRLSDAYEAAGKDLDTARWLAVGEVEIERGHVPRNVRSKVKAYEIKHEIQRVRADKAERRSEKMIDVIADLKLKLEAELAEAKRLQSQVDNLRRAMAGKSRAG